MSVDIQPSSAVILGRRVEKVRSIKKNNSFPWFPTLPFLCRVTIKSLWLNVLWIRRGGWNKRIRLRAITPQCITMLPYIVYYVSPFCVQPRFRARLSICYLSNSLLSTFLVATSCQICLDMVLLAPLALVLLLLVPWFVNVLKIAKVCFAQCSMSRLALGSPGCLSSPCPK